MKVLLICKSKKIEVLGLMYLSAAIKQSGHECKIVEIEQGLKIAKNWNPDVIGYSIMTGDQEKFRELNKLLKQNLSFLSVAGGPHVTFYPLDCDWADRIIRGEGEEKIIQLLEEEKLGKEKLGKESNHRYKDINSFPWPDRTDFPNMKIRDFIAARGCPWSKCAYCYNDKWNKLFPELPKLRTRKVDDVVAEIKSVNPEFVYFQDSCFGTSIKWLKEFNLKYKYNVGIPFHCHLRPSQATEERIVLLADSNCRSLRIALESASPRLRKFICREDMNNDEMFAGVRLLKKWRIKVMIQNILGLPTSTLEDDMKTLELNMKLAPDYAWSSIFAPFPGTVLGDYCKKEGLYDGDYRDIHDNFFDASVLNFPVKRKEQMECLQRIFALAVETQCMPEIKELTCNSLPKYVHRAMRRLGDKRLYMGLA